MRVVEIIRAIWRTAKSVLPIFSFLIILQVLILKKPLEDLKGLTIGVIMAILGLHMFLKGASMSLISLGDAAGRNLVVLNNKYVIILLAFIIGYFGTLVEPALRLLALEVEEISIGAIPSNVLINTVAVGFGAGMGLGILKILNNIPTLKIIMPILFIIIILCLFAPPEIIDIAMDSASATTGPVNIPINMAIAIGLAQILDNVDPLLSGFGIIGLTSLGTVISVLTLGILARVL